MSSAPPPRPTTAALPGAPRHDGSVPDSGTSVFGALALELRGDAAVARTTLAQACAGDLAALIARDLGRFAAQAASLQLVSVGAHYDPVEVLRPGWPLHRDLEAFAARAPGPDRDAVMAATDGGKSGRVVAFGAHDGAMPGDLAPSVDFFGGPLRLVPFVLNAAGASGGKGSDDARALAAVGEILERELLERGMAGADTALFAQESFGLQVEHARYLTVHDLAAMMALQYDHAGLAPLWPLLETALLQPGGEAWLDAPPEPLVHYVQQEARIALFSPAAWQARHAAAAVPDSAGQHARLAQQHQQFEARQRQFAAVLGAHGVAVTFVHCDGEVDDRIALS